MPDVFAEDFTGIQATLSQNPVLKTAVLALVANQPMPGKVTEGGDRMDRFRAILMGLVDNQFGLNEAYRKVEVELPRGVSLHGSSNRVFASGWAERLVRIQFSRCYNQAVMEQLIAEGETQCFVPHSSAEKSDSKCSMLLAGSNQDLKALHNRLVRNYANGVFTDAVKIPDHPHCTHVVTRHR